MQYLAILFDSHAAQAFAQMEQGPDELLDMYLHCANVFCQTFIILEICLGFCWKVKNIIEWFMA